MIGYDGRAIFVSVFSLSLSLIFVVLLQVELHHESCGLS